ncbi:phosphatidylserine decarboxylase [Elasticomyces elasticus]|nr:phosphatidylserine decarboxylase [Elasticomyces elasticus]
MPQDDADSNDASASRRPVPAPAKPYSLFEIPAPVKRVFNKFPLVTYPSNELPLRAPRKRQQHVLHVFATPAGALRGLPSFNPSCLKWQTYLKFSGVQFRVSASSNHASPTGALPFLIPSSTTSASFEYVEPVPANKLRSFASTHASLPEEPSDLRYEVYVSLLDHRLRAAWLYTLYLEPSNFTHVAHRLYISPCSSNALVAFSIAYQLRNAAEAELRKLSSSPHISTSADTVLAGASDAFSSLSTLLGEDYWFYGAEKPGLFDASVFAYTHLLLDESMGWRDDTLGEILRNYGNLVEHRNRISKKYY